MVVLSFPFIFIPCPFTDIKFSLSGDWRFMFYYIPFIIIFQVGWAIVQISHLALISDLSECATIRTQLNSIRNGMTVVSGVSVYVSFWLIFGLSSVESSLNKNDYKGFQWVAIGVTAVGLIFSVLHHIVLVEKIRPQENLPSSDVEHHAIIDYKYWLKSFTFYKVTMTYMIARVILNVSQVYIVIYLIESTPFSKIMIAVIPLAIYVTGLITCLIMPILLNKFLNNYVIVFGIVIVLISSCWIYTVGHTNSSLLSYQAQTIICSIGFGISTNLLIISTFKQVTDMIGKFTVSNAFVMGSMSFADKIINGVIVLILQYLVPHTNTFPGIANLKRQNFFRSIIAYLPAFSSLVLLLITVFINLSPVTIESNSNKDIITDNEII